jgi:hypothetical protein
MNGGLIKIAKPYAALIGDNKNGDAGLMGKLDRFGSIWHKVKIFHPIRVAMINVNNTITIQKKGRARLKHNAKLTGISPKFQ